MTNLYVDSVNGDDGNDGLTRATAKQTLTAIKALGEDDCTYNIARGSRFHERPGFMTGDYALIRAYGSGNKPILDASLPVSGTWTQHGTYTNVWYLDVTLRSATTGSYASPSSAWHPAMWDEDVDDTNESATVTRVLRGDTVAGAAVATDATINALLTIVNANAGTFTVHLTGSTNAEPRSDNGTEYRFYIHTRDGVSPNSTGRTIFVAEQTACAGFYEGQRIEDIVFQRPGGKDMISVDGAATKAEYFRRCDFLEAAVHGPVLGGVELHDCNATAHTGHGDSLRDGGGAFHQYRSETTNGASAGVKMTNLRAKGFFHAVYSHGNSGGVEHDTFEVDGLIAENCTSVFSPGNTNKPPIARNVVARNCNRLATVAPGVSQLILEDVRCDLPVAGGAVASISQAGAVVTLRRAKIHGGIMLLDPNVLGTVSEADYPTLVLENSTIIGTFADPGNAARRQQNWTLVNSILGHITGSWSVGDATADGTSELMINVSVTSVSKSAGYPG